MVVGSRFAGKSDLLQREPGAGPGDGRAPIRHQDPLRPAVLRHQLRLPGLQPRGAGVLRPTYPSEYMESVEALLLACAEGFQVAEVPVHMSDREAGTPSNRRWAPRSTTTCACSWSWSRPPPVEPWCGRRRHESPGPAPGHGHRGLLAALHPAPGPPAQAAGQVRPALGRRRACSCGAFAIVPDVLVPVADWVGIAYEPAVFFLAAIAFLFLMVVHFSFELSRTEERTRTLAEEIALLRARLDKSDPPAGSNPDRAGGRGAGGLSGSAAPSISRRPRRGRRSGDRDGFRLFGVGAAVTPAGRRRAFAAYRVERAVTMRPSATKGAQRWPMVRSSQRTKRPARPRAR